MNIRRKIVIDKYKTLELHGFSDASEKAYGAAVYVRSINSSNQIKVQLLCSKSKLSLARLELCAAVLLIKLILLYYWTDSSIALA